MAQTAGEERMLSQGMDLGFSVSHSARDTYSEGSNNKRGRESKKPEEIFFLCVLSEDVVPDRRV